MAAEALMAGSDEDVQARLEAIAPIAHWRNVFLFAAGKCIAERRHLRDTVVRVCEHWNDAETDRLAGATLAGSRLALELLLDGVTGATPKYARRLGDIALRLMEVPDVGEHWRLAAAYQSALDTTFRQRILQRLGQARFSDQRAAWKVLVTLAGYEVPWAQEVADTRWPQALDQQVDILQAASTRSWGLPKMVTVTPHIGPHQFVYWTHERREAVHVTTRELATGPSLPAWYRSAAQLSQNSAHGHWWPGERFIRVKFGNLGLSVGSALAPAPEDLLPLKDMPSAGPEWWPYISAIRRGRSLVDIWATQAFSYFWTQSQKKEPRTLNSVSHRLSTIADADRIVVLEAGRVVASGRHADLVAADGPYAELIAAQCRHV